MRVDNLTVCRPVICGIDPGTNQMGFASLILSHDGSTLEGLWATTVKTDKLPDYPGFDPTAHIERVEKLLKIREAVLKLLTYWKPYVLSCESPFYNGLRPNAYGPLVEAVLMVKLAAFEHLSSMQFSPLEPSLVKKTVGAGAISGKDAVRSAVLSNTDLARAADNESFDLTKLDEHAIDAVAIAYSEWKLNTTGTPHAIIRKKTQPRVKNRT